MHPHLSSSNVVAAAAVVVIVVVQTNHPSILYHPPHFQLLPTMSSQSRELLHLYRQLLRSCATYPSKNRWRIYRSIQDEFREKISMNPADSRTQQQIQVAFKGLSQLQMYDPIRLSRGNPENPNWEVTLEQNPMPKPPE